MKKSIHVAEARCLQVNGASTPGRAFLVASGEKNPKFVLPGLSPRHFSSGGVQGAATML